MRKLPSGTSQHRAQFATSTRGVLKYPREEAGTDAELQEQRTIHACGPSKFPSAPRAGAHAPRDEGEGALAAHVGDRGQEELGPEGLVRVARRHGRALLDQLHLGRVLVVCASARAAMLTMHRHGHQHA